MLIEVMVGAVVLAIATGALLNGIDGAQGTGARNKARSTAAALAEQDQERMRAMPVASLAGFSQTRTVTVRGVSYTITSTATWATDTGGPISCSNNSKSASNLRILSEVSSAATKGVIDEVGLVTPPPGTFAPGQGRGIVKLADRDGNPWAGASVNLTGAASLSGTTNSLGCAVFQFAPVGAYTASVSGLNLVDWEGNSPAAKALSIVEKTSTLVSLEMDEKAQIQANFDTAVGSATVAAKSRWLSVSNSKLTAGVRIFEASPAGAPNTLVTATNLYPFLDGYGAYSGNCTTNNPGMAPTSNSSYLKTYSPAPGQVFTMTSANRIRVPSINVQVVNTSSNPVNGATVFIKSNDSGCTNTFTQTTAQVTYGTTTYQGVLPEPGFPYGTYKLCAQASATGPHGHADVRGSFSYTDNGTSVQTETSTNLVDETVSNTNPAGTTTSTSTSGSVRIRLTRSGPCH